MPSPRPPEGDAAWITTSSSSSSGSTPASRPPGDFEAARAGVRAVFQTLREAVTGDAFEDVLAQLPREYTALLDESE
jgi:hypothetical protein